MSRHLRLRIYLTTGFYEAVRGDRITDMKIADGRLYKTKITRMP